jgi:hypothetical protein
MSIYPFMPYHVYYARVTFSNFEFLAFYICWTIRRFCAVYTVPLLRQSFLLSCSKVNKMETWTQLCP